MKSDLFPLIIQLWLTHCGMFYEVKPLQHFFLHKSGFLQCSRDSSASLYVCLHQPAAAAALLTSQWAYRTQHRFTAKWNGRSAGRKLIRYSLFFALPASSTFWLDQVLSTPLPRPHTINPHLFQKRLFYSLILHRRFSSLIFFSACHFVILSPLMHVALLIWNAWVSGTDIWTVLCGRLFVALMCRVSFGMSERMHPTEWKNVTIDRHRSKRSFNYDRWRGIWSYSPLDMPE